MQLIWAESVFKFNLCSEPNIHMKVSSFDTKTKAGPSILKELFRSIFHHKVLPLDKLDADFYLFYCYY